MPGLTTVLGRALLRLELLATCSQHMETVNPGARLQAV